MQVLAITLPIFLLIALGHAVTWRGLLTTDQVRDMGVFTINVTFPALLYRLLARYRPRDVLEWRYALVYGAASVILLAGGFPYWRRIERCGPPSAAVRGFGMAAADPDLRHGALLLACTISAFVTLNLMLLLPQAGWLE